MSIDLGDINYLAVLVAMIVQYAGGAVWYGILANPWLDAIGKTKEEIRDRGDAWKSYLVGLVATVVTILGLAVVVEAAGADDILDGLVLGLITGVGIVATAMAAQYSFEGRPLKLYTINVGYPVVVLAFAGAILGAWQ